MRAALRMELRRMRSLVGWTALAAIAYGAIVAAFYPTFRDNERMIEEYMSLFPKGLLTAFGMQGSLADPGIFFNMYISGMLWPVIASIAAIVLATRPVAGDLERGFLEVPLSTRLSRVQYLGAAIAGQAIALLILVIATTGGIFVMGRLVGAPFDAGRFAMAGVLAFAFGIAIAAVTTLLAVVTLDRGRAAGIAVGIILAMYLLDAASRVLTGIGPLAELSAFHHLQTADIIDRGAFPLGDVVLFAVVAGAAWTGALVLFRGRDLAA